MCFNLSQLGIATTMTTSVTESFVVSANTTFSRDFASLGLRRWNFALNYGPGSYGPEPLHIVWAN